MAYLKFNSPIPDNLPIHLRAQLLSLPPGAAADWLHRRDLAPAGICVRPTPIPELHNWRQPTLDVFPSPDRDDLLQITLRTAERTLKGLESPLAPYGISDLQEQAFHQALKSWIEDFRRNPLRVFHRCSEHISACILQWMFDGDVGLSSKAIARTAFDGQPPPPYNAPIPTDSSDLRRCVRLLHRLPELHSALELLALHYPRWDEVRDHFPTLEYMLRAAEISGDHTALKDVLRRIYYSETNLQLTW